MRGIVKKHTRRLILKLALICLALSFFVMSMFSGCNLVHVPVSSIRFTQDDVTVRVGDEIRIDERYVEILPELATNKNFRLESSDTGVLKPNYLKVVEAVGVGEAYLTVTSEENAQLSATLYVTVDYAIPEKIGLSAEGRRIQYEDENSSLTAVTFSVLIEGFEHNPAAVSPDTSVQWFAEGKEVTDENGEPLQKTVSDTFSFQPEGQGLYEIGASVSFSETVTLNAFSDVRVYKHFSTAPFTYSSEDALLQEEGAYKTIIFDVDYEEVDGNPEPVIVWYLNDEPVTGLAAATRFPFLPAAAGKYKIRLTVNGEPVHCVGGQSSVEVVARGISTPRNVRFDFDADFPKHVVSWDSISDNPDDVQYAVTVKTLSGKTVVADYLVNGQNRIVTKGRIGTDIAKFIGNTAAQNIFNTQFQVSVKSLGGDIFTPSAYTAPVTTAMVSIDALPFLEKTYYDGNRNYYASSFAELCDIYTYTAVSRQNQYTAPSREYPTASFSVYIGFPYASTVKQLLEHAFSLRHMTGYAPFSFSATGSTVKVTVTYQTDGLPSTSSQGTIDRPTYPSSIPHTSSAPYDASRALPIEKKPQVTVSNSEQLYIAAEEGFYPVVTGASKESLTAKAIYAEAQSLLRYIISNDMTDVEKAHAIYDTVMWRTSYDYRAVGLDRDSAVKHTAYYLDGAFDEYGLAVCDGIAKAYSLLCNMEGIPALRVAGKARSLSVWEGHAWNKIQVDGKWYNVDCTWGKKSIDLTAVAGKSGLYDVAGHRYFLRTDAELESTHREDTPNNYPRTSLAPLGFFEEGLGADFYMDALDYNEEAQKLADYMVEQVPKAEDGAPYEYNIGEDIPRNKRQTDFVSFDIRIHQLYFSRYQSIGISPLTRALEAKGLTNDVDFYTYTDFHSGEMYQRIFISVHLPDGIF